MPSTLSVDGPTVRLNSPVSRRRTLPTVAVHPQFTTVPSASIDKHTHARQLKTWLGPDPPWAHGDRAPSPASVPSALAYWLLNAPATPTSLVSHHGLHLGVGSRNRGGRTITIVEPLRERNAQKMQYLRPGLIVTQLVTQWIKDQLSNLQN